MEVDRICSVFASNSKQALNLLPLENVSTARSMTFFIILSILSISEEEKVNNSKQGFLNLMGQ